MEKFNEGIYLKQMNLLRKILFFNILNVIINLLTFTIILIIYSNLLMIYFLVNNLIFLILIILGLKNLN